MNPVPLFLIIVTLPLLLGGCGEKTTVNEEEVEEREGVLYIKGSDTLYTGVQSVFNANGQKLGEENYKDGRKVEGSEKFWNNKGEPVDSMQEAGLRRPTPAKIVIIGEDTQERGDLVYLIGSKIPYTGIGQWNYRTGEKMFRQGYKDGKKDGLYVAWHENGKKSSEGNWKDGKQDGLHVGWHEGGQTRFEGNYKDGKKEGLNVKWHDNGQKAREQKYKDGVLEDGPWTSWYENGQKWREENWKDGKKDGLETSWHKNGQKMYKGNYKDGKCDGLFNRWHENGQKSYETNWKDGNFIKGSDKYWNSKGKPVADADEAEAE